MQDICCPPFSPVAWDCKTVTWTGRRFARDRVRCLYYIPLGFGTTMRRLVGKVAQVGAQMPDALCLSDHTSPWNMDVYLSVDRDLPGVDMVDLGGRFLCKVYEGPYGDTRAWCKDFEHFAQKSKLAIEKYYMWYTTCPKCAKKYGKNYVVIVGKIKEAGEDV